MKKDINISYFNNRYIYSIHYHRDYKYKKPDREINMINMLNYANLLNLINTKCKLYHIPFKKFKFYHYFLYFPNVEISVERLLSKILKQ